MTETTISKTGVIGLGAMGLQMARHMAAKGFEVYGADIDHDAMRRASAHGVRPCGSATEIGERAEIVVVMVATDAQVEDVIRTSGLLDRLRPGAVICISSSVAPQTCRDLAAIAAVRDIGVIDTRVVLGQEAANKRCCREPRCYPASSACLTGRSSNASGEQGSRRCGGYSISGVRRTLTSLNRGKTAAMRRSRAR